VWVERKRDDLALHEAFGRTEVQGDGCGGRRDREDPRPELVDRRIGPAPDDPMSVMCGGRCRAIFGSKARCCPWIRSASAPSSSMTTKIPATAT